MDPKFREIAVKRRFLILFRVVGARKPSAETVGAELWGPRILEIRPRTAGASRNPRFWGFEPLWGPNSVKFLLGNVFLTYFRPTGLGPGPAEPPGPAPDRPEPALSENDVPVPRDVYFGRSGTLLERVPPLPRRILRTGRFFRKNVKIDDFWKKSGSKTEKNLRSKKWTIFYSFYVFSFKSIFSLVYVGNGASQSPLKNLAT